MNTQLDPDALVARTLLGAYIVGIATSVPLRPAAALIVMVAALATTFLLVTRRMKDVAMSGAEVFAVSLVSAAPVFLPGVLGFGGERAPFVIRALALPILALFWCHLRWKPRAVPPKRQSFRSVMGAAGLVAGGLTIIAAAAIGLGGQRAADVPALPLIVGAYFGGALCAGIAYWVLQDGRNRVTGRFAIGVLGTACLYAAVGLTISASEGEAIDIAELAGTSLFLGSLVGPAVVFNPRVMGAT